MTKDDLKKLRQYYHSLLSQKSILDEKKGMNTDQYSVDILTTEIEGIHQYFPEILPPFNPQTHFSHLSSGIRYYDCDGVRSYLATAIARLKVTIDEPEDTPVTVSKDFTFISNPDLKNILVRDFQELQRAYISECWKSVIILSGGAIEAILTDLLLSNSSIALSAHKAPKKPDITKWDLSNLIDVSVELKLVSSGIEKLSHSLREYRNLVHPGNEIREKITFDKEEAKIAIEVLNMLYRDLSI